MDWTQRIDQRPDIMLGKPVIKGTRITVEQILESLAEGMSESELLDAHPRLSDNDIQAALAYAAAMLSTEKIIFFQEHVG